MERPVAGAVCIGEGLAVLVADQQGPLESATRFTRSAAGAEANVASALAALGVPAAWVSRVGDDGFGRYLTAAFAGREINVTGVETDPDRPTGIYFKERLASARSSPAMSRMHYYRHGSAASALGPDLLQNPAVGPLLDGAGIVHTTGVTLAMSDTAADLVRVLAARPRRFRFSFDLNWRPLLWKGREKQGALLASEIVAGSDVVFLGSDEAEEAFGEGNPDRLRARFPQPETLVIKNDRHSAVAYVRDNSVEVPALSVEVAERIGAGDAFAAGYLGGLLQGRDPAACLRQGHLLAAHTLTGTGDQADFDALEIEALLDISPEAWAQLTVVPTPR